MRDLTSGALTAIVSLAYSLSCAALIFSGTLSIGLPYGIAAMVVAMSLCALAVALFSPFPRAIAGPDGNAAAVLGTMAAAIAAEMTSSGAGHGAIVATVLCGLAIATAFTGLTLFVLGELRAARWVRFIPQPVIGGFIAAVGWLLVVGAVGVATGSPLSAAHVAALLHPVPLVQMLATVVVALGMLFATSRLPRALGIGLMFVAGVAAADLVFAAMPGGLPAAAGNGWFLSSGIHAVWTPWYLANPLSAVSWAAIAHRYADVITVILVSTITILFYATAFEIESHDDVNLDAELRADGIGNLASAVAGGFTGYFSLTRSVLNLHLGGKGRASGITVAVLGAVALFTEPWIVEGVPRFVLAGLLLYLGIMMLDQWVLKAHRRVAPLEFAALLLIFVVNVWLGFLAGLVIGLMVGVALFAFNYSRVPVVSQSRSGIELRSHLTRSPEELAVLAERGGEIRVFLLQGYLFFGMADRLYRTVRADAIDSGARLVILDFQRVLGMDSAAVSSFIKIARSVKHAGAQLVFTAMGGIVARQWTAAAEELDPGIQHFADLDHALEWGENSLVERYVPRADLEVTLHEWLAAELGSDALSARFAAYLQPVELAEGEALCREGEPADSMFFVERGRIGITLQRETGEWYRLRSLGSRTMLGEMGLYRRMQRSASAIAERVSFVHVLTRESFQTMQRDDPDLATAFHNAIVRALADRLSYQNAQIFALTQ